MRRIGKDVCIRAEPRDIPTSSPAKFDDQTCRKLFSSQLTTYLAFSQ